MAAVVAVVREMVFLCRWCHLVVLEVSAGAETTLGVKMAHLTLPSLVQAILFLPHWYLPPSGHSLVILSFLIASFALQGGCFKIISICSLMVLYLLAP